MCCARLAGNAGPKNLQKFAIWAPCYNFLGHVFSIKAHIDNWKKNLLNSNVSLICPHNVVNFGPLEAEICWRVWGSPANFNRFWATVCKTVAPYAIGPLSVCPVCPVLSVTFVHCGQTVGRIKTKLGMHDHISIHITISVPNHVTVASDSIKIWPFEIHAIWRFREV